MTTRCIARALAASVLGTLCACASPFDRPALDAAGFHRAAPADAAAPPDSRFRADERVSDSDAAPSPILLPDAPTPDDFVRFALYHSVEVEAAYQRWRAATERLPQVRALPDPRLTFGYYIEEVQTRTGAQEARLGVEQSFPWFGALTNREDAAAQAAMGAWREFESVQLAVAERVVTTLHDLAYLDGSIRISRQNLSLLTSFEQVLRARYRVGTGSHPELTRVQVELGHMEDRLAQLEAMRPAYAAELNATLNRPANAEAPMNVTINRRIASVDAAALIEIARRRNPTLRALDEQVEQQRALAEVARRDGLPEFTIGLDYIVTDDALDPTTPGSGDDPILLRFGFTAPIWRDKYDAGVREATARRLALANQRAGQANRISADIQRAWFEHTDANRRVQLYERSLIPKAEESLRASLASFRAGETSFLDLLDTERTLLEFAIAAERARAESGKALARLTTLVGEPIPTESASTTTLPNEASP